MTRNPFVYAAQDPLSALALLGYVLFLASVVVMASAFVLRKGAWLYVRYEQNHTDPKKWWGGWLPPSEWTAWAAALLLVLAIAVWALGGIVYVIAP